MYLWDVLQGNKQGKTERLDFSFYPVGGDAELPHRFRPGQQDENNAERKRSANRGTKHRDQEQLTLTDPSTGPHFYHGDAGKKWSEFKLTAAKHWRENPYMYPFYKQAKTNPPVQRCHTAAVWLVSHQPQPSLQ